MSQENVEIVRQGHETFNRRDLYAYLAVHDPDMEFTPFERAIEGLGPYRGHDDVRRWWDESLEVLRDLTAQLHEVRDLGDDLTLACGRLRGHGAGSGACVRAGLLGGSFAAAISDLGGTSYQSEAEALKPPGHRSRRCRRRT